MRGAAGISLGTTANYLCGTTIECLRHAASTAAGNGPGTTANCLRRATSGAAG
jgi:hypothetical protein